MTVKFIHIAPLALLAVLFGSCDHDAAQDMVLPEPEPVVEESTPIAFAAKQADEAAVTRAALSDKGVTTFKVYGFKNMTSLADYQPVFPGYTVNWVTGSGGSSTTNSSGWEYVNQQPAGQDEQTVKYWDWNAKAYRFFAVAGTSRTNTVTGTYIPDATNPHAYEVTYRADAQNEADVPYYSHLWFSAGGPGEKPFGQPVQLEFIKPLSKVRIVFIFEENINPGTTYATANTLTDISFRPTSGNTIKLKGNVTVTYHLIGTETTETFAATAEAEGTTTFTTDYYTTKEVGGETVYPYYNANGHTPKEYTVLPVTGQGTYRLTVSVDGEPKTTIVPAEFMDWQPGYEYTYIFKIHVDKSVEISSVQSAFTQWTMHEAEHTVHNW